MEFLIVYIREAHALDSPSPTTHGMVEDPITDEERASVASTCVKELKLDMFTALIDRMDDRVNKAYKAHPDRLFLVGRDGRMAYSGGRGPFGFSTEELESAIKAELAGPAKKKAGKAPAGGSGGAGSLH